MLGVRHHHLHSSSFGSLNVEKYSLLCCYSVTVSKASSMLLAKECPGAAMMLESVSLWTMCLNLEIGCASVGILVDGSSLKYRVIVKSPHMSCGMCISYPTSAFSWSIKSLLACICYSTPAYLATKRNSALPNALYRLLGASGILNSSGVSSEDAESEKWRRLGWIGASEKHSSSIGASGVIFTAALDTERTLSLFVSVSYRTTG